MKFLIKCNYFFITLIRIMDNYEIINGKKYKNDFKFKFHNVYLDFYRFDEK